MKLQSVLELRGIEKKFSSKSNSEYLMFRFEDTETGESLEVMSKNGSLLSISKKGNIYLCDFKYNSRFKNLELLNISEVK